MSLCSQFRNGALSLILVISQTIFLSSSTTCAQGVLRGWDGGGATDDWFDPANWSPNGTPDDADFLSFGFNDVGGLSTNNVNISNGGRLEIFNNSAVAHSMFLISQPTVTERSTCLPGP